MYFIRDKKLAQDLADNKVTQKQSMLYMLLLSIFCGLFMTNTVGIVIWSETFSLSIYDRLTDLFFILTIIITFIISYRLNGGIGGQNFVERYVCLSLPITITSTLIAIVLIIPAMGFDNAELLTTEFEALESTIGADQAFLSELENLDEQLTAGKITEAEHTLAYDAIIDKNVPDLEFKTGILSFLAMLLGQLYVIWRYAACFRIFAKQQDEK